MEFTSTFGVQIYINFPCVVSLLCYFKRNDLALLTRSKTYMRWNDRTASLASNYVKWDGQTRAESSAAVWQVLKWLPSCQHATFARRDQYWQMSTQTWAVHCQAGVQSPIHARFLRRYAEIIRLAPRPCSRTVWIRNNCNTNRCCNPSQR